jgi:hypothetical protein
MLWKILIFSHLPGFPQNRFPAETESLTNLSRDAHELRRARGGAVVAELLRGQLRADTVFTAENRPEKNAQHPPIR